VWTLGDGRRRSLSFLLDTKQLTDRLRAIVRNPASRDTGQPSVFAFLPRKLLGEFHINPRYQMFLCGRINPGNEVAESNENNNVTCLVVTVLRSIDVR